MPDLFIENKITEQDKDRKLVEFDASMTIMKLRRSEIEMNVEYKEPIIDGTLLFMSNPGQFWNPAPIKVKRRIQDAVSPNGLIYNCETGFGTVELAKSYLLIQKLASEDAKNSILVAATGIEPVTSSL